MKKHSQKVKLLKLWDILRMETSPEYPMSSVELLSRLEDLGIDCDRKTLYKDIEELNKFGYTIKTIKKKRNLYYVDTDVFSMAELKILADSVAYANFIPADKAKVLIEKISVLGNEEWVDQLSATDTNIVNRATNSEIYENIVILNNAIAKRKKITFKYFDYDFNLTVTYRKKGEKYKLNPIKLVSSNNKYYLVGYDDKHREYTNYRIDRMHDVKDSLDFISIYEGLDEKKLKEMIILHILLYFLSGRDLILNLQNYSIHKFLTLVSWILFFYIFYFLIYYDYRKIAEPDLKVMTKKEIFQLFRKRASENNKIFLKNKPFVITFVIYLALQGILLFFK